MGLGAGQSRLEFVSTNCCADCTQPASADTAYAIFPPRPVGNEEQPFWLCRRCWDQIMGEATLMRLR